MTNKKTTQRKLSNRGDSPLFPVELKKGKQEVSHIENADFPQEVISDSMSIAKKVFKRMWRPNDYRRQIKVKIKSDRGVKLINTSIANVYIGKRNKLLFCDYKGIKIQYGKNTLTGFYSQKIINGEKEVFVFEASKVKLIEDAIRKKKAEIMALIDEALFSFIKQFNIGLIGEVPIWERHEDWTVDEEIKKIPEWTVIQEPHFKKVYPVGIEDVGGKHSEPVEQLINRVRNSGLRDFSPEIVGEIDKIRLVQGRIEALSFLKDNVRCPADLVKYSGYYELLSDLQKEMFCGWIYDNMELMYSEL